MIIARSGGFGRCVFTNPDEILIAELCVPLHTQRRHRSSASEPPHLCQGVSLVTYPARDDYEIEYGHLIKRFSNRKEVKFFRLLHKEQLLCSAKPVARSELEISTPHSSYGLRDCSSWSSLRFQVQFDKQQVGQIYERGFTIGRRLFIDLDRDVPLAIQCFMVFLISLQA